MGILKTWLHYRTAILCVGVLLTSIANAQEAGQAQLTAPQLFPDTTLAYVRIDDVRQTREALKQSSIGRLGNDENLKPILSEFYGSLVNNTAQLQNALGLNLDELLALPTGELAVAVLPSDRQMGTVQRKNRDDGKTEVRVQVQVPSLALLMNAGAEIAGVQVVLERIRVAAGDRMVASEKTIGRLTLVSMSNPNRSNERFGYFIDKSVFVACTDLAALENLAAVWQGNNPQYTSLADNRRFTSLLGRCVGTQGERPQVSFYADPLAIARQFATGAVGTTALAVLPALGIDGIQAIGGSTILTPPDFDSISHLHVLLGSPRRSILGLLRPQSGSTTPEFFVPDSAASYFTVNWDVAATLQAIERLYDQFRGEDAFDNDVIKRVSERVEFDFRADFLENLQGRVSFLQGFVRPIAINSGSNVYAIKLKDPNKFKDVVLPKLLELAERRNRPLGSEQIGQLQVNVFIPPEGRRGPPGELIRRPEICIAVLEDYLVVSDSRYMMNEVARCVSEPPSRLSETLDFQLISERVKAQLQGKECSALSYGRPEESLQLFYELARDSKNIDRLREMSKDNGFLKALVQALDNHKLPDFSVIAKYLAPGGGFLVDEETGLHYMSFSLRRE